MMPKYPKKQHVKQERRPHLPRPDSQAKPANTDFVRSAATDAFGSRYFGWRQWANFRDASPAELMRRRAALGDRRSKKKSRKKDKALADLVDALGVAS